MVATVSFGTPGTASMRSAEWQLLEAVRHRQARRPGSWTPALPGPVWDALRRAAERENTHLHHVERRRDLRVGPEPWPRDMDLAVLWTDADTFAAQVEAGQALARVLLTARAMGIPASLVHQPFDGPDLRVLFPRSADIRGAVQAVLRLGDGAGPAPTPRRPLDDVLSVERFAGPPREPVLSAVPPDR